MDGQAINFLNLRIPTENEIHALDVSRKATSIDTLIHGSFFYPNFLKFAAFNATHTSHRLVTPLPSYSQYNFRNEPFTLSSILWESRRRIKMKWIAFPSVGRFCEAVICHFTFCSEKARVNY